VIEAISTIVILGAVGSVTSTVILAAADGYLDASVNAQLHSELSNAMDRIVRELRRIPRDVGAAGIAPDIDDVTSSSIDWNDSDGANAIALNGTVLELDTSAAAVSTLLTGVSSFTVQAYDESDAALANPLTGAACHPIRRVSIEITLDRSGVSETLRTRVFLRSTMSGAGS
jgi:hypothetical protein